MSLQRHTVTDLCECAKWSLVYHDEFVDVWIGMRSQDPLDGGYLKSKYLWVGWQPDYSTGVAGVMLDAEECYLVIPSTGARMCAVDDEIIDKFLPTWIDGKEWNVDEWHHHQREAITP